MPVTSNPRLGAEAGTAYPLVRTAVPVCMAPNGTVATDGTVTLGTALPTTYAGGIWLRLPANAIVGGSAGLYWAVMASTTVGQVYTNFQDPASPFAPFVPGGTLVAAVGSNAAYTQTSGSDVTLINITVPGGSLGMNGSLRVHTLGANSSSANTKSYVGRLATVAFASFGASTSTKHQYMDFVSNRGNEARNVAYNNSVPFGATTGNHLYLTINTAVDTTLALIANMPAGDAGASFFIFERVIVEVLP